MTRRFALVALWLAATVVAVLLATYAVRLAGDKVVAQGPATVTHREVEDGLSSAPGSAAPGSSSPPTTTTSSAATGASTDPVAPSPSSTAPPTTASTGGPASPSAEVVPGPSPTSPPTSSGGSGDPAPPTTAAAAVTTAPPAPIEQSFPLVGGIVRMRCVGDTASLVSSSPNPGYAMDVRATGPREVEVRFTGADHTSELKGSCAGGAITAEPKESGGGSGSGRDG